MRAIALALSLVLIFMIPWEGMIEIARLGTAAKIVGIAVGAFWLATVLVTGRFRRPGLFHVAVAIFVVWNAVSVFWSADAGRSLAHVATWAQLFILILILWDLYTTRDALMAGLQAYVLGAYVAIGGAIFNFILGNPFYTRFQRFSPGDTNPDGFGFILVLGIPVAWYLASSKNTTKMSSILRLINFAYIPVAFVGLALAGTRTAAIAVVPAMVFGFASLGRLRLSARIVVFLLLTAAVLFLIPEVRDLRSFQRLGTTFAELSQGDLNQRLGLWREGLASFVDHPLLGVGSNMYRSINNLGKVAHNSFISVLVELGLVGLTLFGTIVTIAVVRAWNHPKWEKSFWLTMIAIWFIGSSAQTWEHRKTTWLYLGLIVASAALVSGQEAAKRFIHPDRAAHRLLWPATSNHLPAGRKETVTAD